MILALKLQIKTDNTTTFDSIVPYIPVESIMFPNAMLIPTVTPGIATASSNSSVNVSFISSTLSCNIGTVTVVLLSPAGIEAESGVATKSSPAKVVSSTSYFKNT